MSNGSDINRVNSKTIDNWVPRVSDNASVDSEKNRTVLMYNRWAKLENWKEFQSRRSLHQPTHMRYNSYFNQILLLKIRDWYLLILWCY